MTFRDVTIAMDLSLNSPGFAVLAVTDEGEPIVLECTRIVSKTTKPHGYRLIDIDAEIRRLITTYDPEHYVREKGFSRFAATTQSLFKVVGVSDIVSYKMRGRTVEEISPTTVKKVVAGHGKASKAELAEAVFRIMRIENRDEYYIPKKHKEDELIDDKTDAIAVGLCYLAQKGIITL